MNSDITFLNSSLGSRKGDMKIEDIALDVRSTAETITQAAAAGALLFAAKKWVFARARAVWDALFPLKAILSRLDTQDAALADIRAEMKPNGGGSLKDLVRSAHDRIVIQELRLRSVMATSPVALYECDAAGNCTWVNDRLCDLFGLDHEKMLGNGWLSAIAQDERVAERSFWTECVERDIPYSREYTIVDQRTGERRRCKTTAVAHRDARGEVMMFQGFVESMS